MEKNIMKLEMHNLDIHMIIQKINAVRDMSVGINS